MEYANCLKDCTYHTATDIHSDGNNTQYETQDHVTVTSTSWVYTTHENIEH
jgi:hypothetical protein